MMLRRPYVLLLLALCMLPLPVRAADMPEPDYSQLSSAELERVFFDKLMDGDRVAYRNMNLLVWEPHFDELVSRRFGCLRSNASGNADKGWTLADDILVMLGGPPNDFRIVDDRYVVGSACRHHSCDEKSIMIADLRERQIAFGLLHYVKWAPAGPKYWDTPVNFDGYLSVFVGANSRGSFRRVVFRIAKEWAAPFLQRTPPLNFYVVNCYGPSDPLH